jgi:dTDP-4-dehydrorhamnose 3,5-epimerase-like enzyme
MVAYMVSESYDPTCDIGIRYDSFWYDWKIDSPIVSEKDQHQDLFSAFSSSF